MWHAGMLIMYAALFIKQAVVSAVQGPALHEIVAALFAPVIVVRPPEQSVFGIYQDAVGILAPRFARFAAGFADRSVRLFPSAGNSLQFAGIQ